MRYTGHWTLDTHIEHRIIVCVCRTWPQRVILEHLLLGNDFEVMRTRLNTMKREYITQPQSKSMSEDKSHRKRSAEESLDLLDKSEWIQPEQCLDRRKGLSQEQYARHLCCSHEAQIASSGKLKNPETMKNPKVCFQ